MSQDAKDSLRRSRYTASGNSEELVDVFKAALATAGFIGGRWWRDSSAEFALYCDAKHQCRK